MKVSVIILHYNRRELLLTSLRSIDYIDDMEVIIIDDGSDISIDDIPYLEEFRGVDIKVFSFKKEEKKWLFPAIPINKAVSMVTGDVILFQGAEIYHKHNIIDHLINNIEKNKYLVYGTFALNRDVPCETSIDSSKGVWYQHSIHSPRNLNFCVGIMTEDMLDIGGFNEAYGVGTNWGDNDFLWRVNKKGMNIVPVDYPYVYHMWHPQGAIVQNYPLYQECIKADDYKIKNSFL